MTARGAIGAAALVAFATLASCGSTQTDVALTNARASVVQGLPVPVQAVLAASGKEEAQYEVRASVSTLDRWYKKQLPPGASWKTWTWYLPSGSGCPVNGSGGINRQWQKGESTLDLTASPGPVSGVSTIILALVTKPPFASCG